jgi:hypothetical protein
MEECGGRSVEELRSIERVNAAYQRLRATKEAA